MFLAPDGTLWIQFINFAIFFAILNVVFLRPVGEAIRKRRAHIDEVQSDYDRYARQVAGLHAEADAKRAAARREAEATVVKAKAAAEAEAAAIVGARGDKAHEIIEQARATVAGEVSTARLREDELSQNLARTLLERAIGSGR